MFQHRYDIEEIKKQHYKRIDDYINSSEELQEITSQTPEKLYETWIKISRALYIFLHSAYIKEYFLEMFEISFDVVVDSTDDVYVKFHDVRAKKKNKKFRWF